MDIQKHARTQQIKRLSTYLYSLLTAIRYMLFLGWPALVYVAFASKGTIQIGSSSLPLDTLNSLAKILIVTLFSAGLVLMLKLNHYFRELMRHFSLGDIFSISAIAQVKGALKMGILFFILSVIQELFSRFYILSNTSEFNISLGAYIIIATIFFGLMYTLLWALEIGCDLNEESNLTI